MEILFSKLTFFDELFLNKLIKCILLSPFVLFLCDIRSLWVVQWKSTSFSAGGHFGKLFNIVKNITYPHLFVVCILNIQDNTCKALELLEIDSVLFTQIFLYIKIYLFIYISWQFWGIWLFKYSPPGRKVGTEI